MADPFKNLKDLAGLMGNREQMQAKFEQMQTQLARKTAEAQAGAGAVRVTVNGKMEVVGVALDPAMIATLAGEGDQQDKAMIEELIASAANEALRRAQDLVKEEMSRMTGGMNLPGLENLLG